MDKRHKNRYKVTKTTHKRHKVTKKADRMIFLFVDKKRKNIYLSNIFNKLKHLLKSWHALCINTSEHIVRCFNLVKF